MIRLQSILRGYNVRRSFEKPGSKGVFDDSIKIDTLLNNQTVNKARGLAGAFNYGDLDPSPLKLPPGVHLIEKGPFKLE